MSVVLQSSGGGSVTLQEPSTASNRTITLADQTGTLNVAGPAFSAYKPSSSGSQSITSTTWTKVTFATEDFDTNSNFATSTFTPTVAGYYLVSYGIDCSANSATMTRANVGLYKNGSLYQLISGPVSGYTGTELVVNGSTVVYMNGTTDYLDVYALITGTSPNVVSNDARLSFFQGSLLRGA